MNPKTFRDLLIFKTKANLRTEVSHYYLNYLWWIIDPILTMLVFYIVFAIFLDHGKEYYTAFLLCGVVSYSWFSRTVSNASSSILNNTNVMLQVSIPKCFFPLEVVLRDCFKQLFVLALLLIFLLAYPTPISWSWAALPILFMIQLVLNAGVALICAAIVPFVPDLKFVIGTFLHLGMFASGVFYSIADVATPSMQQILYLNPWAGLIKNYRDVLIYATSPDWVYLAWIAAAGILLFALGLAIIWSLDHIYPRVCQR